MKQDKNVVIKAEQLVRKILSEQFNQKIDAEMVRAVAKKVSLAIPERAKEDGALKILTQSPDA